jgi:hypothetical protein
MCCLSFLFQHLDASVYQQIFYFNALKKYYTHFICLIESEAISSCWLKLLRKGGTLFNIYAMPGSLLTNQTLNKLNLMPNCQPSTLKTAQLSHGFSNLLHSFAISVLILQLIYHRT